MNNKTVEYQVCNDITLIHYTSYQQFENEGAVESDGYHVSLVPVFDKTLNGDIYEEHALVLSNWFCEVEISESQMLGKAEYDGYAQATQLTTALNALCRYFNEGGDITQFFDYASRMVTHFDRRAVIPSIFPNPVFVCPEFTVFSTLFHLLCVRRSFIRGKPKLMKSPYTTFSDSDSCMEKLIKQWGVPLEQRGSFIEAMKDFHQVRQKTLLKNAGGHGKINTLRALLAKEKKKEAANARGNKRPSSSGKRKSNPRQKREDPQTTPAVPRTKNRKRTVPGSDIASQK